MTGVSLLLEGRPILISTAPASVTKLLSRVKTRLGHLSTWAEILGSYFSRVPTSNTSIPASARAFIMLLWSALNRLMSTGWSKWCSTGSVFASSNSFPGWWTRTFFIVPLSEVIP